MLKVHPLQPELSDCKSIRFIPNQKKNQKKNKRKFTRKNRSLVEMSHRYGMMTIILLNPILISLILGAFLLRIYYPTAKKPFR
ncbi:MAG: hypothetical protein CVT99_14600 [Bacteroidetes bacterium HGW-Bacteroidetes-16]|nr:MAG: hypothetical protein CVT99_14600 [Bacteroidetes bacterium HGW-Bacteroidetes-16]